MTVLAEPQPCDYCSEFHYNNPPISRAVVTCGTPTAIKGIGRKGKGTWHLCASCASRPLFSRMKQIKLVCATPDDVPGQLLMETI
jgi:hypothetical protein